MEDYYWRVVDAEAGSVIIVLCGVCRGAGESWAAVALAAHPGGPRVTRFGAGGCGAELLRRRGRGHPARLG
jgi:hypothetical protein